MIEKDTAKVRHAKNVYAILHALAVDSTEDPVGRIFTGKLSEVYAKANVPTATYSDVRAILVKSESIEILKRGAGGYPSVVRVVNPPFASSEQANEAAAEYLTDRS